MSKSSPSIEAVCLQSSMRRFIPIDIFLEKNIAVSFAASAISSRSSSVCPVVATTRGVLFAFEYSISEASALWCEKSIIASALPEKSFMFSYTGKGQSAPSAEAFISIPASSAFVPPAAGLVIASYVVRNFMK